MCETCTWEITPSGQHFGKLGSVGLDCAFGDYARGISSVDLEPKIKKLLVSVSRLRHVIDVEKLMKPSEAYAFVKMSQHCEYIAGGKSDLALAQVVGSQIELPAIIRVTLPLSQFRAQFVEDEIVRAEVDIRGLVVMSVNRVGIRA